MAEQNGGKTAHPNIIEDPSTESAGILANDIAAEEDSLFPNEPSSYGSASQEDEVDEAILPAKDLKYVISGIFMASFLAALDTTVVSTLLSLIASDLNAVANISWIATAYLLSCSAFQPLFGKLSDIFGRKPLILICTAVFALGCIICVTDSLLVLVIGRFVTGLGGSGLTTLGTITMSDLIPLRERGLYQGLANVFFGLGAASGGIIGGFVADVLGWKYVFILQVPLAFLVFFVIYFKLHLPAGSPGLGVQGVDVYGKLQRVDFVGSFFLVSALMAIMSAASLGGDYFPFSSKRFIGLVLGSVVLLGAFIYTEARISKEPILPMDVMVERTVLASSLTNWFATMAVFTNMFYVPIYFSSVLNLSATQSGARLLPNFFFLSLGSVLAGYYMKKTGKYFRLNVFVETLLVLGMINVFTIHSTSGLLRQYTLLVPSGFAYAAMLTITLLSLIAAVPMKYQACTTSIQYTFRATGSTLGISVASAIFQNILKAKVPEKVHEVVADPKEAAKIISRALENTKYIAEAPKYVQEALRGSYALACKGSFLFSLTVACLGYFTSLFMREHELHTTINRK